MKIRIITAYLLFTIGHCSLTLYANDAETLQQLALTHRAEGNLQEAIRAQSKLLEMIKGSNRISPKDLATHYFNLGVLYSENKDYHLARKPFKTSIEITQENSNKYSKSLIDTLARLGIAQLKLGYLDQALDSFQQAQHIVHRTDGVKSVKQEGLLTWMSVIEMRRSRVQSVDTLQRFRYEIFRSNYGESDPKTVPALLVLAKWFQSSAQYTESVKAYKRALELVEINNLSTETLQRSLSGLAETYYLKGICCADEFMERRAKVVSNDGNFDNSEKSQAYIDAADMSVMLKGNEKIEALYQEAWLYAGSLNNTRYDKPKVLGISRIDRMVQVYRPESHFKKAVYYIRSDQDQINKKVAIVGAPFPLCALEVKDLANNHDYSKYVVNMDFAVTAQGRATNIRVVETNAPSSINQLMRRMVKLYRFRPKLTNGVPVEDHMQLRQTFDTESSVSTDFQAGTIATIHGCHLLAAK